MDWNLTKRKLCIFIPNYKRANYIKSTINQFHNQIHKDQYLIVIGNDGIHEDFSDLSEHNVVSFTLERQNPHEPRNGSFIRNYFIKRCQSDIIIQKDPETIFIDHKDTYNSILNMDINTVYRPHLAVSFNKYQTTQVLYGADPLLFIEKPENINLNQHFKMHHFFAIHTKVLQDIQGYDEDFKYYGPEDQDMWARLISNGRISKLMTSNAIICHLDHEFDAYAFHENHNKMVEVLHSKDPKQIIRNNENWGNG